MALSESLAIELIQRIAEGGTANFAAPPFFHKVEKFSTEWKKGGTANNGKGTNYGNKNSRSFNEKCYENLWIRDC